MPAIVSRAFARPLAYHHGLALVQVWGVIQSSPQLPVLADGLFPHYTRPASPATFEADIQLPNITCEKCTLQLLQFVADHARPLDKGWPVPVTTAARQSLPGVRPLSVS